MTKQLITLVLFLASPFIVASSTVEAQSNGQFVIDVPFDFFVAGQTLPSGRYIVGRLDQGKPNVLIIKNADNRTMRLFITQRVGGDDKTRSTSRLVFKLRGGNAYLFQVWQPEDKIGNQLSLVDENEGRDKHCDASTLVSLRAKKTKR